MTTRTWLSIIWYSAESGKNHALGSFDICYFCVIVLLGGFYDWSAFEGKLTDKLLFVPGLLELERAAHSVLDTLIWSIQ